jgi:PAS domain S-box-containing protein
VTGPAAVLDRARLVALRELDFADGESVPQLDRFVELVADICGANLASFTIHDETRSVQIATSFGERETIPRETCICSVSLNEGVFLSVSDARADPRTATMRHVTDRPYVRSYMAAPVAMDGGAPVGVLSIGHTTPGRFGDSEALRLRRVAGLVSGFLETRRASVRAARAAAQTEGERLRQTQFELIFNAIGEGVNVYTADGRIVESNPAALAFEGLGPDSRVDRSVGDGRWTILRPDGSTMSSEDYPVNRALRGEVVRDVDVGVLTKDALRWVSINAAPIVSPNTGEIAFGVMTFKDITQQRVADDRLTAQNQELAEALASAEQASRAKSDFLGVMSHELRTPMNAVLGCARLLAETQLDPVQKRTLGVLKDAGGQMLALLNDLFDMTGLDTDKVRVEREPVSLVRLIEDAAVIWASEVQAKGLSLSVMIDPALIAPRDVDPARLLQIIGNLMANAIKFTTTGGVAIQAWPAPGRANADRVMIEVSDTGPGVPREAAERIFSAFEQVDISSSRRHGGLGLGLHVARRLAIAMGGDVHLESEEGEGSRFTLTIAAPVCQPVERVADKTPGADAVLEAKDVLCVDDNPRNLYVLGAMLRAAGHRPIECASGHEALVKLEARKFDVILLDMVMPEMDGLDLLARLRAEAGPNQETPVIACTANVLPHQVESYVSAGTAAVLAKPIDVRAMLEAVASAA